MNNFFPNQKYEFLIVAVFYISFVPLSVVLDRKAEAANITQKGEVGNQFLQGAISQNELTDGLERLGIKCIIHEDAKSGALSTLSIEKVRLGSSAYYGGVLAGDIIKNLSRLNANTFTLIFERSGKIYQVNLQMLSGQAASAPLSAGVKENMLNGNVSHQELSGAATIKRESAQLEANKSALIGNAQKTDLSSGTHDSLIPLTIDKEESGATKKLISYDIELIIDITGSMSWVDGTGNLTKFQWCHEQVRKLSQILDPYHKTFTITTFNTSYQTMEKCNPEKVEQIYATIQPSGNTDLVHPLEDRLNTALIKRQHNGHPVLIVVITDGLPNVPRDIKVVNRALINFTHELTDPDEVVVTILQIGDTFEGRDFCVELDDNLVNEGAKYDIIDTRTFAELKQEGLVKAMIDAVLEARSDHHLSKSEKDFKRFVNSLPSSKQTSTIDPLLKERQDERRAIEKEIFGQEH